MPVSELLQQSLNVLSHFFVGDKNLDDTLNEVVQLAQSAVVPAEMTGLTMSVEGRLTTTVFTNRDMVDIDVGQYATEDGPCVSAFRTREIVRIDNLVDDTRWPRFQEKAINYGIASTLSMPLIAGGNSVGALNFYAQTPNAFDADAEHHGYLFAQQAGIVLANSYAYWGMHELNKGLQDSMASRAIIEQAKGILMARSNVDSEAAFNLLVEASQRSNRKLREVAQQLVTTIKVAPAK